MRPPAPGRQSQPGGEAWEVAALDLPGLIAASEMLDRLEAGDFYVTEAEARLALADPR